MSDPFQYLTPYWIHDMIEKTLLAGILPVVLTACAVASPPDVSIPSVLVPDGQAPSDRFAARGVQIYECRATQGVPAKTQWVFVAPEADLYNGDGARTGRHFEGPRWQAADGSTLVGVEKARAAAPVAGAIPWLLLTTTSAGGNGRFSRVTSVQRINTVGGVAPLAPCDGAALGTSVRVPYTADYVFLSPASTAYRTY